MVLTLLGHYTKYLSDFCLYKIFIILMWQVWLHINQKKLRLKIYSYFYLFYFCNAKFMGLYIVQKIFGLKSGKPK